MQAKICGIKDTTVLNYIINHPYPPKYIGFICNYQKSKRYVEFENLVNLTNSKKKGVYFVAVLVNPSEFFLEKIKNLSFDYYQLYNVSPIYTAQIKKKYNKKIITALTVENEDGRRVGIGYSTDDNSTQSLDKRIQQDDLTLHRSIREKLFKLIFGKDLKKKNVDFDVNEVSPPARRHQAKGIKKDIAKGKIPKTYVDKKTGKRKKTNPWAMAWAQYDKYGKPSSGPDKGSKTMKRKPKK